MKKYYSMIVMIVAMTFQTETFSQWTDIVNNEINYEFKITNRYYGGGPDEWDVSEPVIRTQIQVDGNWISNNCFTWTCNPPCYNETNEETWSGGLIPFDSEFSIHVRGYESDSDFDACIYEVGDDYLVEDYALLRQAQQSMKIVYPSTDFRPVQWIPYLGDAGNTWLFPDDLGVFNQGMAVAWKYTYGWNISNCLNFPTLQNNDIKSDINANRPLGTPSTVFLEYENTFGFTSRDVWYAFTIEENSNVTISTDHAETDFDTVIRLFNLAQTEIGYVDDTDNNNHAVLNAQLCAGTYKFCVEGYDYYSGLFKVTVGATTIPAVSITDTVVNNVSCASNTDGSVSWAAENAISTTEYWFNGVAQSESTVSNLAAGDYLVEVTDGCGAQGSWNFTVVNGDNIPPVAQCETSMTVVVSPGNPAEITVEEIDNGSGDNCAGATAAIFPSSFDTFDVGSNIVTMTVTDSNGLTNQCICNVNVELAVGLEEISKAIPIVIQPNPNSGSFQLDLSAHNFSSDAKMQIADCTGRIVYQSKAANSNNIVILADAAPGVYMLNLIDHGHQFSTRFVVQ